MRTARARRLRIAGRFADLYDRRTVRPADAPYRREDSDNEIHDSSRFAPFIEARVTLFVALVFFARNTPHRRRWGQNRRSVKIYLRNARHDARPSYTGKAK